MGLVLGVGSCQRQSAAGPHAALQPPGSVADETSYLAPPRPVAAVWHEGGVRVLGLAPPHALVEIASPEGEQARGVADARGGWGLRLAAAPQPRLYAISAAMGQRIVHAEGALMIAPGALSPAVVLRAGYAALPLLQHRSTDIATVDYDPSGFIAVAGDAAPRAKLTLRVDGAPAAVAQADGTGRYALLAANHRLAMGSHRLEVMALDRIAQRQVVLEPPQTLTAPYQSYQTAAGWRVEWALNGGGVQTTLILDP